MASLVSSDNYSPPTLFKVNPSNSGVYRSPECDGVERCPLCNQKSKAYYCKDCVASGNFYHSSMKHPERYADKKLRLMRLQQLIRDRQPQVEAQHRRKTCPLLLKEKIKEKSDRVELLRLVIKDMKKTTEEIKTKSAEVSNINAMRRQQLPLFKQRLLKMKKVLELNDAKIRDKGEHLTLSEAQLKGVVQGNIRHLTSYIFPITEVKPARSTSVDTDPEHLDTVSAIAEASQTTYVRGRWVYTDTSHETQYRIIEPLLPGSGDYSAYNLLSLNSGGGECEESDSEERGGGYSVCAGLTYLTQLVNMLSFFLDVTLPKKLCYSEFCRVELSEQQFARRVARLNTNVLYLCLSQNVSPKLLRPTHTVSNILALLDTTVADLGRQGSFEIDESLLESMEEGLEEDQVEGSDSEEEDTDTLSAEWETVPNLPPVEPPSIPTHQPYSTFNSTAIYSHAPMAPGAPGSGLANMGAGAGGIVSSAAASVMSLFRGFSAAHQK